MNAAAAARLMKAAAATAAMGLSRLNGPTAAAAATAALSKMILPHPVLCGHEHLMLCLFNHRTLPPLLHNSSVQTQQQASPCSA
jgi:hypothetical protein